MASQEEVLDARVDRDGQEEPGLGADGYGEPVETLAAARQSPGVLSVDFEAPYEDLEKADSVVAEDQEPAVIDVTSPLSDPVVQVKPREKTQIEPEESKAANMKQPALATGRIAEPAAAESVAVSESVKESLSRKRRSLTGSENDDQIAPVRLIVSTTRSPRVFPMLSKVSTFDQVIQKKLPNLREQVTAEEQPELYHMVTALESKRAVFEQAFVEIKQLQEAEVSDQPNPKTVAFSERLDLIYVRDMDKVIEYLTRHLPMDLEAFFDFFQWNFSLTKTQYTISLAQFIQIYIVYIEQENKARKQGNSFLNQPFYRASESMTEAALKKYIFGENFLERQDLISEKLSKYDGQVRELFQKVNPSDPSVLPLGRVKEFWLHLTMLTRCIMVKAGTEYHPDKRLLDDPECLTQLSEHISLAHFVASKPSQAKGASSERGIIRKDGDDWPRQFVKSSLENRDPDAIIKPKVIKFADEAAFGEVLDLDNQTATQDFALREIQEFFQTRRSVVLVDLDMLKNADNDQSIHEVKLNAQAARADEPPLVTESKKPSYVEKDASYVDPPSTVTAEEQKDIDQNLLEVFNFYSRKFASVRGDFQQLHQNLIVLGLQGYTRFCRDFKVPLTTSEITLVWKKASLNHQPLEFDQFQRSITLLGVHLNKCKVQKFQDRQKLLKKEQKRRKNPATEKGASANDAIKTSTQISVEKMTDGKIQDELNHLLIQIGRTQILSEDQSRIQSYKLLEIQYPEKYRAKLPSYGENELKSNILQAKKLVSTQDHGSNVGGSSRVSNIGSVLARLTSNPPPVQRGPRPTQLFKDIKKQVKPRGQSQRPSSFLSPKSQSKSMHALQVHKQNSIENPNPEKPSEPLGSAFNRKQTELATKPQSKLLNDKKAISPPPEITILSDGPTPESPPRVTVQEKHERQNLAEIHKVIRLEKQKTGRVLTVLEAKKQLQEGDQKGLKKAVTTINNRSLSSTKPRDVRKSPSIATNRASLERARSKDKLSPGKMLPLNKLSRSRDITHGLKNKTPSMVDLAPEKNQSTAGQKQANTIPASLTFEDIQKMHYSNLNKAGGTGTSKEDEFRPQDFLDLDSGDSDNEILAKFKPETDSKIINLLQPQQPIKRFVPPYLAAAGHSIEEQTGYSNSPKFSIYRLNNQSNLKDGLQGFEDQMANLQSAQDMQLASHGNTRNRQNMFDDQNDYFPQSNLVTSGQTPTTGPLVKGKATLNLRKYKPPISSTNRKNTGVSLRTPITTKSKVGGLPKAPLPGKSGTRSRAPALGDDHKNDGKSEDIFQSHHNQLPRDTGDVSSHPQLGLGGNMSEIVSGSQQQIKNGNINDDRTTTLGVLSILNDQSGAESPRRLPVQQILDEQQSIASKRNSTIAIGDGLQKPSLGRNKAHVGGTARLPGDRSVDITASRKRLGQLTASKRQSNTSVHKKDAEKSVGAQPKFITDQKVPAGGLGSGLNRQLRQGQNFVQNHHLNQPLLDAKLPHAILQQPVPLSDDVQATRQSQAFGAGVQGVVDSQLGSPPNMHLQSMLPSQLSRDNLQTGGTQSKKSITKTNSAVSSSNQRALMRAEAAQKRESQNRQRRMDSLLNMHEQNLQKGLNKVSRR